MKEQILEYFPFAKDKVEVIYNGLDLKLQEVSSSDALSIVLRKYALRPGFVLAVGHLEKRKNYPRLLKAIDQLRRQGFVCHLVIVGNIGDGVSEIREQINAGNLSSAVTILTGITDQEVRCLYQLCRLFVFPSLYEGFGIPILEAMAAQKPMAISDLPVFREITGNNSFYFDPYDADKISGAIMTVCDSPVEQKRQIEHYVERLHTFDYDSLVQDLNTIYDRQMSRVSSSV